MPDLVRHPWHAGEEILKRVQNDAGGGVVPGVVGWLLCVVLCRLCCVVMPDLVRHPWCDKEEILKQVQNDAGDCEEILKRVQNDGWRVRGRGSESGTRSDVIGLVLFFDDDCARIYRLEQLVEDGQLQSLADLVAPLVGKEHAGAVDVKLVCEPAACSDVAFPHIVKV